METDTDTVLIPIEQGSSFDSISQPSALRKKLTPAEEDLEIRSSIVGAYRTIMERKALTVAQLEVVIFHSSRLTDPWNRRGLEQLRDETEGMLGSWSWQQKNSRDQELEEYTRFAYWALVLSYTVLYVLLSAHLGRNDSYAPVMKGVHVWSIIMMVSISVASFIRWPRRNLKVVKILTAGLLFISSLFVFCLLQFTL